MRPHVVIVMAAEERIGTMPEHCRQYTLKGYQSPENSEIDDSAMSRWGILEQNQSCMTLVLLLSEICGNLLPY